jgi:hypothetical protein
VIATPLGTNVASVDVVHTLEPAGRTATRMWSCPVASALTQETAIVPSAPTATRGVVENPAPLEMVKGVLHLPPDATAAPIDADPPFEYKNWSQAAIAWPLALIATSLSCEPRVGSGWLTAEIATWLDQLLAPLTGCFAEAGAASIAKIKTNAAVGPKKCRRPSMGITSTRPLARRGDGGRRIHPATQSRR